MSIYLSTYLSLYPPVSISIYLYIYLSTCPYIYLSIYLSYFSARVFTNTGSYPLTFHHRTRYCATQVYEVLKLSLTWQCLCREPTGFILAVWGAWNNFPNFTTLLILNGFNATTLSEENIIQTQRMFIRQGDEFTGLLPLAVWGSRIGPFEYVFSHTFSPNSSDPLKPIQPSVALRPHTNRACLAAYPVRPVLK